jgi:class 3 adenylate cyclase/tetratricopeptide (TPR) repeat protein
VLNLMGDLWVISSEILLTPRLDCVIMEAKAAPLRTGRCEEMWKEQVAESLSVYIPIDRRQAIVRGEGLPDRTRGAALFADISGFTPLTNALAEELGPRRGAEELTRQLNAVYGALITEVHRYRGSVIGFSGDAITCWFDDPSASSGQAPSATLRQGSGQGSDQAGLRATACALALQQAMGQFAEVATPSGQTVSLAIKVAVTAGPARRFLVGDPQRQYLDVLAGATLERMAAAEALAEKGEVVVGAEVISQLSGNVEIVEWREDVETSHRFAVISGLADQTEVAPSLDLPTLSEEQARPWLLPPIYERLKVGRGQFLAEIRPVVALFLKFGGIDYDEDDAAGAKLDAYIRWVQSVLARYDESYLRLTVGDKGSFLFAAFGVPLVHDDDAARAVAVALELRSPPGGMDFVKDVQIGLSQGRIWAGACGSSRRCAYDMMGDEVNLAARLMGKAQPGQILVSKRVADAAAKNYDFRHPRMIALKGLKDPLPIFEVLGRRIRPLIFTSPLLGREDELAQMEQALQAVLSGKGQVLRLEGGAGIGKSHLAAEFSERAINRGLRVVQGTCQSTSQGIAYYPWRQVLRSLLGLAEEPLAGRDLKSWTGQQIAQVEALVNYTNPGWLPRLPLLGDLLDLPIPDNATTAAFDARLRQEALFALAVEMVQNWAQGQPLLLLVEDVHWMDEASLGLTLNLSRAMAKAPLLLLLVHRPPVGEGQPLLADLNRLPYHTHLHLQELSPQGVAALVANRLQGRPSALALTLIQTQAQGNPFFAVELVNALHESGALYLRDDGRWALTEALFNTLREANCLAKEDGDWVLAPQAPLSAVDLGISDSVQGIVLSRIDRLPEEHKLTLKAASVVGHVFEFDLLARSHPHQPAPEALLAQMEMLQARGLIRLETPQPEPTYAFRHHITQEGVYGTLLESQRRELHGAVGQALEDLRPEAVERLAYHYSRSAVRDKTLLYLDKAARKTQREYANETALNYYKQALELEERWEWCRGQVKVLHILGRREDQRAALESLTTAPGAPGFEVAYLRGQYHEAVGEYAQAQAATERALSAARDRADVAAEAGCLARLGLIARRQGEYDEAKNWYDQALELLEGEEAYPDEKAQVLNGLGIVHREQGDFDQAKAYYEQALTMSRLSGNRRGEAQALNDLGVTAFYERNFAEALAFHRQTLEIRRTIGDRAGEGMSLYNLAQVAHDAGDFGQAEKDLLAAMAIFQTTGNRWHEVNVWNDMGILYHELGDLPTARTCLRRGLQLAQEIGDESGQAYILANLGLVTCDKGDLETAERLFGDGLALAQGQDDKRLVSIFLNYLSVISLQLGKLEQAVEQAEASQILRQAMNMRLSTTDNLATLAAVHLSARDMAQALDCAQQALAILEECSGEGPEFPQRDYFICYQVLAAAGQEERAQVALQSAYDLVMARADKITDPALRQSFLEKVRVNREIVEEYVKREP